MRQPDPSQDPRSSDVPSEMNAPRDLEATAAYPLRVGLSLDGPEAIDPPSGPRRFDFLAPPRAAGELGWLAHYRVIRLIGEGGMGLVLLAEDNLLSRPVALKVIRPEIAGAPGIAQRFTREARATAAIKHDHIVTIYHVGQQNGVPFLAMEYLEGMTLARWLGRGVRPSVDLVLRIGREIAEGLAAAHQHGLIHRDIKPANIWLEAPSGRVKILDFGQARSVHDDVQITHSGTIMGTPAYMSPEQAAGEPVSAASDLFSLGCVLYRLCTSRSPFEGETIMAVLSALSSNSPRPLRELEPGIRSGLDDLVMRLLAKDPVNRPASAQAVVDAFKAIERDLMVERQKAELAEDTSHPAVDDAFEPLETRLAQGSDEPRPSARPRVGGRLRWIAAVLIATGASAAVTGGFVFAPRHQGRHRIAAQTPMLASVSEGRMVRQVMTTEPAGPHQFLPEAGPDQLDPGESVPQTGLPMLSPESVGPEIVEGPNESRPAVPESKPVNPREQRPAFERTEPTGSSAPQTGPTPGQADWGEPIIPDGDCTVDLDRDGNKIKIVVPGTPHVLSAELGRLNAPRILRDVEGDFDAFVKVAGVFHSSGRATLKEYTSPYHGAGILLWQDEDNYVRLEIASDLQHGKPRPYVNFEYRKDGALVASRGLKNKDGSSHLRLKRRGDVIHAAFGPDGSGWTSFPPLSVKLPDRLKLGVSAINTATKPLTAELEGLEISERTRPAPSVSANTNGINPSP